MHIVPKFAALAVLAILPISAVSAQNTESPPNAVCHIANAGILAQIGDKAVLFDGIVGTGLEGFTKPTDTVAKAMDQLTGPFGEVDVVVASHIHGDHFNAESYAAHIAAHPDVDYILTPESWDAILAVNPNLAGYLNVHPTMPAGNQSVAYTLGDMNLTVTGIDHSDTREPQNIGVYAEIDGYSFFHPGDISMAAEKFAPKGFVDKPVDFLFIPYWYSFSDAKNTAIHEAFEPVWVVPMHLPMAGVEAPWMAEYGGYQAILDLVQTTNGERTLWLPEELDCFFWQ